MVMHEAQIDSLPEHTWTSGSKATMANSLIKFEALANEHTWTSPKPTSKIIQSAFGVPLKLHNGNKCSLA